jgi:L-ascorbate metabolism protein UlaG (beta-lactamase superfamily)
MANIWNAWNREHYVSLVPWTWIELESADPPGPFPFIGGVAPEVAAGLHEAHSLMQSAIDTAISDVFAHRGPLDDPARRARLEDAYAEVVRSRPHLSAHIRCGRKPDGTFQWEYPHDPAKSATMRYGGLRVFNAVARQAVPFGFDRTPSPTIGKFIGLLDGTHTAGELRAAAEASGPAHAGTLTKFLEILNGIQALAASPRSSLHAHWLAATQDRDVIYLGHAALLYRQKEQFFLFDPWLMPWLAESPIPSLWGSLLPRPSAIFLTHDHDDHVDPRTLLTMPKDIPVIVPSRKNRRALYYDYPSLLRELGFTRVIELAHGETFPFEGGGVASVPFFGEDPCDIEMPRNCYLVSDRGRNVLAHVDSGPTNAGRSALSEGVIERLVKDYGPIATLFASQQQLKELRTYAAHACLSPPGTWLEAGENGYLTNKYLAELAVTAKARLFVSYATGGADWYPDHLSFTFSRRNPARTALLTANWEPPDALKDKLAPAGCGYHYAHALDIFRGTPDGGTTVVSTGETLFPLNLYRLDHGDPPFTKKR